MVTFEKTITKYGRFSVRKDDRAMTILKGVLKERFSRQDHGICKDSGVKYFTRKSLCLEAKITKALLSYVENGKRSLSWDTYEKLANVLDLDIHGLGIKKEDHKRNKQTITYEH